MRVPLRFHVAVTTTADDAAVTAHVDRLMEELVALAARDDRVDDPAVGLDLSTGHVEVELLVEAATPGAAADYGAEVLRSAFRAAGALTPGWDGQREAGAVAYDIGDIELQSA